MGQLVFQATLGGQVNLVGPNTASTFNINVPAVAGNMVTTGDTGTISSTMLASGLTLAGSVTYSGGTANGVAYLNGSKVLTTGSALVFDGTNLGVGVTPSAWVTLKGLEIAGLGNAISGYPSDAGIYVSSNAYYGSGGWKYAYSSKASTLYSGEGGAHSWKIAASGTAGNAITFTQAMTLDASGNLGVGNTDNAGKTAAYGKILSVTGNDSALVLESTFSGGSTWAVTSYNGYLAFVNGNDGTNTERARIDSSGNLLVGTTSASGRVVSAIGSATNNCFYGSFSASDGNGIGYWSAYTGTTGTAFFNYFTYNGSAVGSITSSGTVTLYNTTSDYRLKTVVGAVTGHGARIDALEPVEYTWKADGSRTRGFLAHKFQEVYASSVSGTKDAVDAKGKPIYQAMQAASAEVIADLVAEIQSLRQRVAQLESN